MRETMLHSKVHQNHPQFIYAALLWQTRSASLQHWNYLHKATKPKSGVVQSTLFQKLFSGVLEVHKRHLRMFFAVEDWEVNVPLNAHGLHKPCIENPQDNFSVSPLYQHQKISRAQTVQMGSVYLSSLIPWLTWALWIRAFFPSQSTALVGSSGLAVAQSMMVWMPTNAAGRDAGFRRSPWIPQQQQHTDVIDCLFQG